MERHWSFTACMCIAQWTLYAGYSLRSISHQYSLTHNQMVAYKRVLLANRKLIARAICFCLFNFISFYCAQSTGTHTHTQYSYIAIECVESTYACARALKFFLKFEIRSVCARPPLEHLSWRLWVCMCVYIFWLFSLLFLFAFFTSFSCSWNCISTADVSLATHTCLSNNKRAEKSSFERMQRSQQRMTTSWRAFDCMGRLFITNINVCTSNIEEEEEEEMEEKKLNNWFQSQTAARMRSFICKWHDKWLMALLGWEHIW